MTREEIWEKPKTEVKLRGYSPLTINTYKAGISTFLDWCDKPYEDLDEEDFRNYLVHIIEEGKIKPGTINSYNGAIRFFLVVILGKNVNYMRTARLRGIYMLRSQNTRHSKYRKISKAENPFCFSARHIFSSPDRWYSAKDFFSDPRISLCSFSLICAMLVMAKAPLWFVFGGTYIIPYLEDFCLCFSTFSAIFCLVSV